MSLQINQDVGVSISYANQLIFTEINKDWCYLGKFTVGLERSKSCVNALEGLKQLQQMVMAGFQVRVQ